MGATLVRDDTRTTAALWAAIRNGAEGVTVDALGNELPRYGYYVGGASWTLVRAAHAITPDDVAGYVSTHSGTRYFGMWVDGGRVYLDAVDLIYRESEAHETARERRELAVFNISTGECEGS
jgi:hypothetical protein